MSSRPTQSAGPNFLHAVAERLAPLFLNAATDARVAQAAAREAIEAHAPQTAADYASIAQVIAFSLAAIGAIAQSAASDLPPNLQLRFLGKANTLSRSAAQAERIMQQRRKDAQSASTAEPPARTRPAPTQPAPTRAMPEPPPDDAAAILASIEETVAQCRQQPQLPPARQPLPSPRSLAPSSPRGALLTQTTLSSLPLAVGAT